MPTLLVTGASGFLGAHLVERGIAAGYEVWAAVRSTSDLARLRQLAPGVKTVPLDLRVSAAELQTTLKGVDAVIHAAAYGVDYRQSDFSTALEINVAASVRLAEAVGTVGCRMVHVGTSYEYGTEDGTIDEQRRLAPTGIYGVTKAAATLALMDLARRRDVDITVVRPFSMYGPLEGGHKFVPTVIAAAHSGEGVDLTSGQQERDYIFVGDVAEACVAFASAGPATAGEIFNLCSGRGVSLRILAATAVAAAGGDPTVLRWGVLPHRPAESLRVVGDPAKAAEAIGWRATTSLEQGMERTAAAVQG